MQNLVINLQESEQVAYSELLNAFKVKEFIDNIIILIQLCLFDILGHNE